MAAPPTAAGDLYTKLPIFNKQIISIMNEDSARGRSTRIAWIRSLYGIMQEHYEKLFTKYAKELSETSPNADTTLGELLDLIGEYNSPPSIDDSTPLVTSGARELLITFIKRRLRFLDKDESLQDRIDYKWFWEDSNDAREEREAYTEIKDDIEEILEDDESAHACKGALNGGRRRRRSHRRRYKNKRSKRRKSKRKSRRRRKQSGGKRKRRRSHRCRRSHKSRRSHRRRRRSRK